MADVGQAGFGELGPLSERDVSSSSNDNDCRPKGGPIYSISRMTQMVRSVVKDEASIQSTGYIANHQSASEVAASISARRRFKSQASIISFVSSSKVQPIDSESDQFLRRFAVNNHTVNSRNDNSADIGRARLRYHRLCFDIFFGASVIDPSCSFHYRWLSLISLAVCYNIVVVVGRGTFWGFHNLSPRFWYFLDYTADMIYLLDMIANSRTGYLEQGILVRDARKLASHYVSSCAFKLDLISIIPTDIAYFFTGPNCQPNKVPCPIIVRLNRLFRFHRLAQFFERTESATNFPFVFRIGKLVFYILVIIHWNACVYFATSYIIGFGSDHWVYQPLGSSDLGSRSRESHSQASAPVSGFSTTSTALASPSASSTQETEIASRHQSLVESGPQADSLLHQYVYCFYWSTLTLTTIGEVPMPERDEEYIFVVVDFLIGLLIFATIVGNIGSMITNMNAARADFQHKMDSVKQWLKFRKVNKELEERIIKWFDYLWANRQTLDEDAVTAILPDRLKAETAIHVHLETLKRVQLFQDCEPGLLVQLVLKLKLQVFSPGDYICRVGDVGKEMYIVKRGELSVLSEDCKTVFGKLTDGSVFGELSCLNISGVKTGNRRTANVRSVGYSDLFALSKQDLWNVLEDYPDAKTLLVERGKQILRKDGLLDDEQVTPPSEDRTRQQSLEQPTQTSGNYSTSSNSPPFQRTRTPSLYGLVGDQVNANQDSISQSSLTTSNAAPSTCLNSTIQSQSQARQAAQQQQQQQQPQPQQRILPQAVNNSSFRHRAMGRRGSNVTTHLDIVAEGVFNEGNHSGAPGNNMKTTPVTRKRPIIKKSLSFAEDNSKLVATSNSILAKAPRISSTLCTEPQISGAYNRLHGRRDVMAKYLERSGLSVSDNSLPPSDDQTNSLQDHNVTRMSFSLQDSRNPPNQSDESLLAMQFMTSAQFIADKVDELCRVVSQNQSLIEISLSRLDRVLVERDATNEADQQVATVNPAEMG